MPDTNALRAKESRAFRGRLHSWIWRDDERGGTLVRDEPVVVHCYTTPDDIQDDANLAQLGHFCRKMGREARQGEIGVVVADEYFAIRDVAEE